jgi:hypothetical protein
VEGHPKGNGWNRCGKVPSEYTFLVSVEVGVALTSQQRNGHRYEVGLHTHRRLPNLA